MIEISAIKKVKPGISLLGESAFSYSFGFFDIFANVDTEELLLLESVKVKVTV